ncbi:MAG: aldolase/citrate lyase family protein [Rhodococcus sp. (in: high G+C Gram-positive bacteria)]
MLTANPLDARHARSWLLVSASRTEDFDLADRSDADAVILDLEDGVVTAERSDARRSVAEWLSGDGAAWVRINAATTEDWSADVDALCGLPGLQGVMLAKSESGQQVRDTSVRLGGAVPVLALVESARGIEFAFDIASEPATLRLAFGSGDFRRDTGAGAEPDALAYARGRLVVASAAAGIAAPIDGPTLVDDRDTRVEALAVTRSMGMSGKLCMHAAHTGDVNRELSPSAADAAWADEVIDRLGADGSGVRSGSDRPQLARALTIRTRLDALRLSY